jgi:hypothetical protein
LKIGERCRSGRLFMISPVHGDCRRCQAEIPSIVFQISGTGLCVATSPLLAGR